jgi:hypothetical protein
VMDKKRRAVREVDKRRGSSKKGGKRRRGS